MGRGSCRRALIFVAFAAAAAAAAFSIAAVSSASPLEEIRILSAERRIDLTSSIVRVYLTLTVENAGKNDTAEVLLAFLSSEADNLATVTASASIGKRKKKINVPLPVNNIESSKAPNGPRLFSVSLEKPLKSGETSVLEMIYVFTHALQPFPAEISQSESQYVYYRDSAILLSPYHIAYQTTYIKTPSNKVESYTVVNPARLAGSELKYGPYHDQPPYSFSSILVHFENNNPFALIEELVREVEISHWGNIQVTEHYKLVHAGARHKGVFSRLEYQARKAKASFENVLARLPPRVRGVYYRDEIGNISSSHLRSDLQKSELVLQPRYPLLGGWKATFVVGYGLPLEDFLFESSDGKRYLNFSFGCPILDTVVDKLTIKVVLPEGSVDPTVAVSFPVEQGLEKTYSYLDVIGRTTVVLTKKNVVPEHNIPFQVYYNFSPVFMLAEPVMLTTAFSLLFVAFISYLHIDLSIRKSL